LLFRAWHRGTREVDLITGRFADAHVGTLTDVELAAFEQLLDVPEPELYAWVTGELPTPKSHDSALFRRMCDFHRNGPPR